MNEVELKKITMAVRDPALRLYTVTAAIPDGFTQD